MSVRKEPADRVEIGESRMEKGVARGHSLSQWISREQVKGCPRRCGKSDPVPLLVFERPASYGPTSQAVSSVHVLVPADQHFDSVGGLGERYTSQSRCRTASDDC